MAKMSIKVILLCFKHKAIRGKRYIGKGRSSANLENNINISVSWEVRGDAKLCIKPRPQAYGPQDQEVRTVCGDTCRGKRTETMSALCKDVEPEAGSLFECVSGTDSGSCGLLIYCCKMND